MMGIELVRLYKHMDRLESLPNLLRLAETDLPKKKTGKKKITVKITNIRNIDNFSCL